MSVILTQKVLLTSLVLSMTLVGCKKSTSRNKPQSKKNQGEIAQQMSDKDNNKKSDEATMNPAGTVTQIQTTLGVDANDSVEKANSKASDQQSKQAAKVDKVKETPAVPPAAGDEAKETPAAPTAAGDKAKETPAAPTSAGDEAKETPAATTAAGDEPKDPSEVTTAVADQASATVTAKVTQAEQKVVNHMSFGRNITIENPLLDLSKNTVNLDSCKTAESRSEIKIYNYSSEGLERHVFILKALAKNSKDEKNPLYFISDIQSKAGTATTRAASGPEQYLLSTAYISKISTGDIFSQNTQMKLTSIDGGQLINSGKTLAVTSMNIADQNTKKLINQICGQVVKNNFLGLFQQKRFSILKDSKSDIVDVLSSSIQVSDQFYGILLQLQRSKRGSNSFVMSIHNKGSNDLKKSVLKKISGEVRIENGAKGQSLILYTKKLFGADIDLARIYQTEDGKVVFAPMEKEGKFLDFSFKGITAGYVFLAQEKLSKLP